MPDAHRQRIGQKLEGCIAVKETKFQTALKKSIEYEGGLGIKLNPQWTVGLPDLFLAHAGKSVFLETKVSRRKFELKDGVVVKPKNPVVEINMTPMQRSRLKKLKSAGMHVGWCVAYQANDDWYAIFGVDPDAVGVVPTSSTNIILRGKGDKWDVVSMMERITNEWSLWDETHHKI